jgi:hypothetical protein
MKYMFFVILLSLTLTQKLNACDSDCELIAYGKVVDAICVDCWGDLGAGNCSRISGSTVVENGISHQVIESWAYQCPEKSTPVDNNLEKMLHTLNQMISER